jgi:hypothetical protein
MLEDTQYHARREDYEVEALKKQLEEKGVNKEEKKAKPVEPIRIKSDTGAGKA